ncbi:hypothetical protein ACFWYW_52520 [Nonomuraea sp. NPDC059023]|uniref:hypothetical protein n=1 Tax=unclassified Nonomuraea TaxID=2593643 RepID=UPI003699643C
MTHLPTYSEDPQALVVTASFGWPDEWGSDQGPPIQMVASFLQSLNKFIDAVDVALFIRGHVRTDRFSDAPRYEVALDQVGEAVAARSTSAVRIARMSMGSPLVAEVIINGLTGTAAAGAVAYLFKNPDQIGGWFPRLQTAWYNGLAEREKAKREYRELREEGGDIQPRELEP